jgi:pimeloyl-ACP methyl ester carboxylesterase
MPNQWHCPPFKEGESMSLPLAYVDISDDVKIVYTMLGKKDAKHRLLLITGLATPLNNWIPQLNHFGNKEDYCVIALDNRGCGHSAMPAGKHHYSINIFAADILALLDHVGWTSNVNIVGFSMGGMIALRFAIDHHAYVGSLTLLSTHAGGAFPPFGVIWTVTRRWFVKDLSRRADISLRSLYSPHFLAAKSSIAVDSQPGETNFDRLKRNYLRRGKTVPIQNSHANNGHYAAVRSFRTTKEELHSLRESLAFPPLICVGTADNYVHWKHSRHLKEILDGYLVLYPGAGHVINEECYADLNLRIENHIKNATEARESRGL